MPIVMPPAPHPQVKVDPIHILRVAPFMAVRDIRYYLLGVQIKKAPEEIGGGVFITACDGHRLAVIHDRRGVLRGLVDTDEITVRITPATLIACRAAVTKNGRVKPDGPMYLSFLVEDKRLSINADFDRAGGPQELYVAPGDCRVEGHYPDWSRVMPEDFAKLVPNTCAVINAGYLSGMAKVLATLGKMANPGCGLVLWTDPAPEGKAADDPTCGRTYVQIPALPEFMAIIMGMRTEQAEIDRMRVSGAKFDRTPKGKP